jgi:hypothetical protein
VNKLTLVIKQIDQRTLRELKAEAARKGLTLAQVFEEAVNLWLNRNDSPVTTDTDRDNEFYESNRAQLEAEHRSKYILITNGLFIGAYDTLEQAGEALKALSPRPTHAILTKAGEDIEEIGEWLGGSLGQ